jgi:hypothetical protein
VVIIISVLVTVAEPACVKLSSTQPSVDSCVYNREFSVTVAGEVLAVAVNTSPSEETLAPLK